MRFLMSQHSTVFAKTERARRKLEIGRIRRELSLASESRRLGSAWGVLNANATSCCLEKDPAHLPKDLFARKNANQTTESGEHRA